MGRLPTRLADTMKALAPEARQLLRRRMTGYILLALTITAGSVYAVALANPQSNNSKPLPDTPPAKPAGAVADQNNTATGSGAAPAESGNRNTSQSTADTSVTVNGQSIAVPDNGTVHKDLPADGGSISIDVTHTSNGTVSNSSILDVRVNGQSNSSDDASP